MTRTDRTEIRLETRQETIDSLVRTYFPSFLQSTPEVYAALEERIRTHGYFLQRHHNVPIPESGQFASWTEYVLEPILLQLSQHQTCINDPLQAVLSVSATWDTLKKSYYLHDLSFLDSAVRAYCE